MIVPQEEIVLDLSGDELGQDLATPTAAKTPGAELTEEQIVAAAEQQATFAPPPVEKVAPEPVDTTPEIINWEERAEDVIMMLDVGNNLLFSWLYFRSAFDKDERKEVKRNIRMFQMVSRQGVNSRLREKLEENADLFALFERWEEVRALTDEIPLNEKEVDMLRGPLARVLEKHAVKPGPESALVMAALAIYTKRATPLLSNSL